MFDIQNVFRSVSARRENRAEDDSLLNLFAGSIGSIALSRTATAMTSPSNDSLAELCMIAWEPRALPNVAIDVWTGQSGIIDLAYLPDDLGRVVLWDDIRETKGLSRDTADILVAIEEYLESQLSLDSDVSVHVGHSNRLSRSIERLLFKTVERSRLGAIAHRIAVIDLGSCGLTSLHWLGVIPLLRRYYTRIIGVDYSCPELCELDGEFEPPHGLTDRARETMRGCDYWVLMNGKSIAAELELSPVQRSFGFTRSICELCDSLVSMTNDIDSAVSSFPERRCAMYGVRA